MSSEELWISSLVAVVLVLTLMILVPSIVVAQPANLGFMIATVDNGGFDLSLPLFDEDAGELKNPKISVSLIPPTNTNVPRMDFNQDKICEFIVLTNGTMVENPNTVALLRYNE